MILNVRNGVTEWLLITEIACHHALMSSVIRINWRRLLKRAQCLIDGKKFSTIESKIQRTNYMS
jgi:hypothetical protein